MNRRITWLFALTISSVVAEAATIDFEDYAGPPGVVSSPFESGGFTFVGAPAAIDALAIGSIGGSTSSLQYCPGCSVTMTESTGKSFTLNSLELYGDASFFSRESFIEISGTYETGGVISLGVDIPNAFVPIIFDAAWTGLTSVTFSGDQFSFSGNALDNINVDVIPVPAAVWLFASGLGLLGFMHSKR